MDAKTDKFTAARIRHFNATGMAVQKPLPFERPRMIAFRWTPANMGAGGATRRARRRTGERATA